MKYIGSKARLSKELAPIINDYISCHNIVKYVEPFVGGANMIEHIECSIKVGADSNEYLISMWERLQQGWIPPTNMSKTEYENIRDNKSAYPKELVAIAGLVATYNAKWFGGYAGIVTTKIGTERNYYDEARRNILAQVPHLQTVKFHHKKFQDIRIEKLHGCLVYCDPPYQNSTEYKDSFCHDEFWNWVRNISKISKVFVSEYNAPKDFICLWEHPIKTTLDKSTRKTAVEKLFTL